MDDDALQPALVGILAALALPADSAPKLLDFLRLLQRWNATYNLTAVRNPGQMLTQHLADSLAIITPLRRHLDTTAGRRLLDVGSGGGLPGIVLAIMAPDLAVTCVDAVGKKAAFIRQVAVELTLRNLQAEHARVENMRVPAFDVITSRAFATLHDFVSLSRRHLAPDGIWMAMKGKRPDDELGAVAGDVDVIGVEPVAVPGLTGERCLVWMQSRRS